MHERGRSARGGSGRWVRVRSALVGVALLSGFGVVLARAAKVQLFDRTGKGWPDVVFASPTDVNWASVPTTPL